jgi:hypothetical protein
MHNELDEINKTGTYTLRANLEGKYFYPTFEQAQAFVSKGWADVITSASFTDEMLNEAEVETGAGEGDAVPSTFSVSARPGNG